MRTLMIGLMVLALAACGGGGGSGDSHASRPVIGDDVVPVYQVLAGVDQGFEGFGVLTMAKKRAYSPEFQRGTLFSADGCAPPSQGR